MVEKSVVGKPEIGLKHELKVIKEDEIHHLLEPGELGAVLELIVSDPNTIDPLTGKPKITEHRVMKSKSFVRQFLELLFCIFAQKPSSAYPQSVRDTTNNPRNVYAASPAADKAFFDMTAGAAAVTHGIIIGDDDGTISPLNINNYVIGNIIPHATMNYSAMIFGTPASDATTSQMTITRNFSNVSGAPKTVNEIALYCQCYDGAARYFMLIRDLIAGGMAVPDGQTLTVNYRPQVVI